MRNLFENAAQRKKIYASVKGRYLCCKKYHRAPMAVHILRMLGHVHSSSPAGDQSIIITTHHTIPLHIIPIVKA